MTTNKPDDAGLQPRMTRHKERAWKKAKRVVAVKPDNGNAHEWSAVLCIGDPS